MPSCVHSMRARFRADSSAADMMSIRSPPLLTLRVRWSGRTREDLGVVPVLIVLAVLAPALGDLTLEEHPDVDVVITDARGVFEMSGGGGDDLGVTVVAEIATLRAVVNPLTVGCGQPGFSEGGVVSASVRDLAEVGLTVGELDGVASLTQDSGASGRRGVDDTHERVLSLTSGWLVG